MTDTDRRVLIFEDTDEQYELISEPLAHFLEGEGIQIERFGGFEDGEVPEGEASDITLEAITEPSPPSLVVLDWVLTKLPVGVRREHVKVACEEAHVPLCVYHREPGGQFTHSQRLKQWDEQVIKIDPKDDPADVAEQCASLVKSFVGIHRHLERAEDGHLKSALQEILRAPPAAESQLDQYSWGRSEAVTIARETEAMDRPRAASTFVGYWIYNQLLRFPGVLLNARALASYLGIDSDALEGRPEVKAEFRDAQYEGPFSEIRERWWTPGIDEIRGEYTEPDDDSLADGPELAERMGFEDVEPALCVAGHEGAGFYCILTDQPVCKEHSIRPRGWIPIGASRARIYEEEFERMRPWMPD